MILPSASKLDLAMACAWPWSRHAMPWPKDERRSSAAARGDAVHEAAEKHAETTSNDGEHLAGRTAEDNVKLAVDELTEGALSLSERAVAYDPRAGTARLLPKTKNKRDYSAVREGEFVGTVDMVAVWPGRLLIVDYKTGFRARRKHARHSWQLRMLACAWAELVGADSVEVALAHIDDGDYHLVPHEFPPWDLDAFRSQLADLADRIARDDAQPNPGHHCADMWCPVRTTCPATKAAMVRLEEDAKQRLPVLGPIESDEQARSWLVGLRLIEARSNAIKQEINEYARSHPVYLGDGLWYGLNERSSPAKIDLSKPGALRAVVKTVGSQAVSYRVLKKDIEEAVRKRQSKRGEGAKVARELYEHLRQLGALHESTYYQVSEYKAPPPDGE